MVLLLTEVVTSNKWYNYNADVIMFNVIFDAWSDNRCNKDFNKGEQVSELINRYVFPSRLSQDLNWSLNIKQIFEL